MKELKIEQFEGVDGKDNCGKSYPVEYVIYTDLFCETDND